MTAFTYLPENELPSLYHWLVSQPFVRPQDGGYSYHDLSQELLSRHLYQRSRKGYYATRRALVQHYQQLVGEIQLDEGREVYSSTEWLELKLALAYQLLLLPDEVSLTKAIEHILSAYTRTKTEQRGEIARVLREVSQERINSLVHSDSRQIARELLHLIESDPRSKEYLVAASNLLEIVSNNPAFPQELLARIHIMRGITYSYLNEYQRAIEDCDRAIQLDPKDAWAYASRSLAYSELEEYQRAIEDCNQACKLDPIDSWVYIQHGILYRELKDYQRAFEDFEIAIELDPNEAWAYAQRGITFSFLKQYKLALADFDRTIELSPKYPRIYGRRGFCYLMLRDIRQAKSTYARSWEQDSTLIHFGWMAEWVGMCQGNPDPDVAERLEMIAATDAEAHAAYVCRGVAMLLRKQYEDALAELEQAIQVGPGEWGWDSYFWRGMTYTSQGLEEEAVTSIEKALDLELPPILLAPLKWFEQDRPDFYHKYAAPLLARYDL